MRSAQPRFLISPDSLKGVLPARAAAEAIARGIRNQKEPADAVPFALADGGEGLVDVVMHTADVAARTVEVSDPLGRPVEARYLVLDDGTAVTDSAEALGLPLLRQAELDPFKASSRGFGELLQACFDDVDVTHVVAGLGGVATLDGGLGLSEVLSELRRPVTVASDVQSPLLGPNGAAAVFGPQKGATPGDIADLDARLAAIGFPSHIVNQPGAGAAGGLGAMLLKMGAHLRPGIDLVMEMTGWNDDLNQADLVITGEGRIDRSTLEGKVVAGVLKAAKALGVPVVAFGGLVDADGAEALREAGITAVLPLSGVKDNATRDLEALGADVARIFYAGVRWSELGN